MLLHPINPFIRQDGKVIYQTKGVSGCAHDARFYYILESRGSLFTQTEEIPLHKYSAIYLPPGTPYHFECVVEQPAVFYAINFDFSREREHITEFIPMCVPEEFTPTENAPAIPPPFDRMHVFQNLSVFEDKITNIYLEFQAKQYGYQALVSALLTSILISLARNIGRPDTVSLAQQMLNYIHENYMNDISAMHLSNTLNYNDQYLRRVFKRQTGITIHNYVMRQRVSAAEKLLKTTSFSSEKVANFCGFKTASHFSQYFKQITGQTPNEFRKNGVWQI